MRTITVNKYKNKNYLVCKFKMVKQYIQNKK